MKSERRHELQHNVLDQKLADFVAFLKRRANLISWAVLIIALIVFVSVFVYNRNREKQDTLQARYDAAISNVTGSADDRLRDLTDLAGQANNEYVAAIASLAVGNEYATRLVAGSTKVNAEQRKEYEDKGQQYYSRVIGTYAKYKAAVAQAHLGLARLAEDRRDFDTAAAEYSKAMQSAPSGSEITFVAQQALNELSRPSYKAVVKMATTAPATSQPATAPASGPATSGPASAPASAPAKPAVTTTRPASE